MGSRRPSSGGELAFPDGSLELELATAGVLHDLRGILGIVKGLTLLATRLIESGRPREALAMLQRMDRTTDAGTALCADVLECSRRNIGQTPRLAREELDLTALAREQVLLHALILDERGSSVDIDAGTSGVVRVRSHRRSLERVISNLLQNAARYGAGRPIDVHVSATVRGSLIIVRDHGRGIPKEALARLFAPYESKGEVDPCFERFGLGLWIVRNLVDSLGGSIHVVSEVDLGTAVSVFLPAVDLAEPDA